MVIWLASTTFFCATLWAASKRRWSMLVAMNVYSMLAVGDIILDLKHGHSIWGNTFWLCLNIYWTYRVFGSWPRKLPLKRWQPWPEGFWVQQSHSKDGTHNWPKDPDTVMDGAGYRSCRNAGCEAIGFDHWFDTDGEIREIGDKTRCPNKKGVK